MGCICSSYITRREGKVLCKKTNVIFANGELALDALSITYLQYLHSHNLRCILLLREVDSEREDPTEQSSKADLGLRSKDGDDANATSFIGAICDAFTDGTCFGFFLTL